MFFAIFHHHIDPIGSIEGDSANSATRDKGGSKQFKTSSLQNHAVIPSQQWSDPCDTSLAVESALCTTGSPRRWCQRVSRKCYESVGAAKGVITSPLKHHWPWSMMDHHDKSASQLRRTLLDWAAPSRCWWMISSMRRKRISNHQVIWTLPSFKGFEDYMFL